METYKVVIPCAGTGSRVGPYTKFMNKALITIGGKPVIGHIIENFDPKIEIIILLGYKGDHIRQVVDALYPERKITYVNVDRFEGQGSGLGYSLLKAEHLLDCPFVFVSNDTLFKLDDLQLNPNITGNWLAYYPKAQGDSVQVEQYRTIEHIEGVVNRIMPKAVQEQSEIYIGLCGIKDHRLFWEKMNQNEALVVGETHGLRALENIKAIKCNEWFDAGNLAGITRAKDAYKLEDVNILEKENEAIWFIGQRVVKFHTDTQFIQDRVERVKNLHPNLVPKILGQDRNLYVYQRLEGNVVSNMLTSDKTMVILDTSQNLLWSSRDESNSDKTHDHLDAFYRVKTIERIEHYLQRYETLDERIYINNLACPPIVDVLENLDWNAIYAKAQIAKFHGDFHSENILWSEKTIKLLDWRQNFGSMGKEYGDVNYDLAKFLHGLIVSHHEIARENYSVIKDSSNRYFLNLSVPFTNVEATEVFKNWCGDNQYDLPTIQTLTALIYLNICGLHEHPYSEFLFLLGRYLLQKIINTASNEAT